MKAIEAAMRVEYAWDHPGYLGYIQIVRGEKDFEELHVVQRENGYLLYCDARLTHCSLKSWDRRRSVAVMEDDTRERLEAFRAALLKDRWKNVVERG